MYWSRLKSLDGGILEHSVFSFLHDKDGIFVRFWGKWRLFFSAWRWRLLSNNRSANSLLMMGCSRMVYYVKTNRMFYQCISYWQIGIEVAIREKYRKYLLLKYPSIMGANQVVSPMFHLTSSWSPLLELYLYIKAESLEEAISSLWDMDCVSGSPSGEQ